MRVGVCLIALAFAGEASAVNLHIVNPPADSAQGALTAAQAIEGSPIYIGSVIQGKRRRWTKDELIAFRLMKKAARMEGRTFERPRKRPCIPPGDLMFSSTPDDKLEFKLVTNQETCEITVTAVDPDPQVMPIPGDPGDPPPTLSGGEFSEVSPEVVLDPKLVSYNERSFTGCSIQPNPSTCRGTFIPHNRAGWMQAMMIDEDEHAVVTRANAWAAWNFSPQSVSNDIVPCGQQVIQAAFDSWALCDERVLAQYGLPRPGQIDGSCMRFTDDAYTCFFPTTAYYSQSQSQCDADCSQAVADHGGWCDFRAPTCYRNENTPAKLNCFDNVSFIETRVGYRFPPPIDRYLNVGWFPRWPSGREVNIEVPANAYWKDKHLGTPQTCPAASGSSANFATPGAVHTIVYSVGFYEWQNNLDWVLLKIFGRTTNLDPIMKTFVEQWMIKLRTEMPHWILAAFDTDSTTAFGWQGWGGDKGKAPFFKELTFVRRDVKLIKL